DREPDEIPRNESEPAEIFYAVHVCFSGFRDPGPTPLETSIMLARLSIRERLIAAFGFLLLATGAIGGFAINRMQAVNAMNTEINANWLPSVLRLGSLSRALGDLRVTVLNHVSAG